MKRNEHNMTSPTPAGKKRLIFALCLLLAVVISTGVTLAYYQLTSGPVINSFEAVSINGATINEATSGNAKTSITVANNGTAPVYVRIRLVSYFQNADGTVDASKSSPTPSFTPGDNWVKSGSYYYYKLPVAGGGTTGNLLGSNVSMESGQVIEVLADTVQATPAQAAIDAWGVNPANIT